MARIIECDVCGTEIMRNDVSEYVEMPELSSTLRIFGKPDNGDVTYKSDGLVFEMCPHCTQRVMDLVKDLSKFHEE